jgi:hypothetical protein
MHAQRHPPHSLDLGSLTSDHYVRCTGPRADARIDAIDLLACVFESARSARRALGRARRAELCSLDAHEIRWTNASERGPMRPTVDVDGAGALLDDAVRALHKRHAARARAARARAMLAHGVVVRAG